MLTVADIRNKVNEFPADKPVEELLDELVLLYKVEKGLRDVQEGKVGSVEEFEKKWNYGGSPNNFFCTTRY